MSTLSNILKTILRMLAIVMGAGTLIIGIMILIYYVPLNAANYVESREILINEGARPDVLERNGGDWSNAYSFEPGIACTTDEIANFDRAAGTEGRSPAYNAIEMEAPDWGPYPRYWHAHCAVLRLLLLFFDVKEMRFLFFILHLLLILLIAAEAHRAQGKTAALIVLSSYLFVMPLAVCAFFDLAFCYANVLLCTYLAILWIKKDPEKRTAPGTMACLFTLIGGITCVADQLFIIILGWIIPMLMILLFFGEKRSTADNAKTVIVSGLSWVFGYGGFIVFKAFVASVYGHENIFASAFARILNWSNRGEAGSLSKRFSALFLNYKHYSYKIFEFVIILWILYFSVSLLRKKFRRDSRIIPTFLIFLGPVFYQFVLYSHVDYHRVYTYRILSGAITATLFVLYYSLGEKEIKVNLKKAMAFLILLLMAGGFTWFLRDDYEAQNAGYAFHTLEFSEETPVMTMELHPGYDVITEFSFGLNAVSETGVFDISLLDGDKVLYDREIPASDVLGSGWQTLKPDWHLKPGKTYTLTVDASTTDAGSGIYVVDDPATGLFDLCGLKNGGVPTSDLPVTWVKYLGLYRLRHYLFYSLSWFAVFLSALSCIKQFTWKDRS